MRRAWLLLVLAIVACDRPSGRGGSEPVDQRRRKLNLVLVLSDTLRAASLPLYGYHRSTAPHLLELARESVVFDRHLANFPSTPVSVSQMLTGRVTPPLLMGFSYALAPVRAVEEDLLVLPKAFREVGYRTGIVSSHPWFDENAAVLDYFDSKAVVKPRKGRPYASFEALSPHVFEFLGERAADGQPFFLYVHSMDTHFPFIPHKGFSPFKHEEGTPALYKEYDSAILYTDHWTHEIVVRLRSYGLLENTIFVFTSDHGEEFNELGREWWNRRHGATVRRAQVHVPLLIRLPADRAPGRRVANLTRQIDLAPTLIRLAAPGFSLARYTLDGQDLSHPLATGGVPDAARSSLAHSWRFWGLHFAETELIYDQWKDSLALYRIEVDRNNYPVPSRVEDPALEARLGEELKKEYGRRTREFQRRPPSYSKLRKANIGIPTTAFFEEGSAAPTYDRDPTDRRWFQQETQLLQCDPGEKADPLVLGTPWAPGQYRVVVRFDETFVQTGYRNRFRIQFLGGRNQPVDVAGGRASSVDLGVQEIGDVLKVRITDPAKGVALTGFDLELQGQRPGLQRVEPTEDQKDRLRALGYVH